MPAGIRAVVEAVYCCAAAYFGNEADKLLMFILSGVLQGCALSGSLFVIAIDPFLRYASQLLAGHEHNTLRACADDIGAVLAHFTGLRQLFHFLPF